MTTDELLSRLVEELADVDPAAYFWVKPGLATAQGSCARPDDVDWVSFDWSQVRNGLETQLTSLEANIDSLSEDVGYEIRHPVTEDMMFAFRVKLRSSRWRGYRHVRSLVGAPERPFPMLKFSDEGSGRLEDLPFSAVEDLATGARRLAIELASHRGTWAMLVGVMKRARCINTSQLAREHLETVAVKLGLIEAAPDPILGDFDETWRAIHGVDTPLIDDPRGT